MTLKHLDLSLMGDVDCSCSSACLQDLEGNAVTVAGLELQGLD